MIRCSPTQRSRPPPDRATARSGAGRKAAAEAAGHDAGAAAGRDAGGLIALLDGPICHIVARTRTVESATETLGPAVCATVKYAP